MMGPTQIEDWAMRAIFVSLMLVLAIPGHAALVDNGWHTTDTVSGLNWLDLSATSNMTLSDSLIANPTWRLATNAEVEDLFEQLFPQYDNVNDLGFVAWNRVESFEGQFENAQNFESLFGPAQPPFFRAGGYTYGLYYDEDNILRMLGTLNYYDGSSGNTADGEFLGANVYGPEFIEDYSSYLYTDSGSAFGTFLVSKTVVPVPAAVWLLGSALAGLGWFRRKPSALI
jgi:hypothetical protein